MKPKKTVLVVGATGLLGTDVFDYFSKQKDFLTYGTYATKPEANLFKLDVTSESSVRYVMMLLKPNIVVNCSALSNVDLCERDKGLAYKVNVKGLENLLNYSKGSKFVHISTDYVFDGRKGNYKEEDERNPLSYYAETKAIGEDLVKNNGFTHLIARVAILYGTGRENFVTFAMKNLSEGKAIKVVRNQFISPTYTPDIAKALHRLLNNNGVFHVAGNSHTSREEMAEIIRKDCKADKNLVILVDKVESWIAARPQNTTLCIEKIKNLGIKMNSFQQGYKKLKRGLIK